MRGGMFSLRGRVPVKTSVNPTRVLAKFTTYEHDDEEKGGSLFSFLFVILVFFVISHMSQVSQVSSRMMPLDIFARHGTKHDFGEISKSIKENMVVLSKKPEFRNILDQKIGKEPEDLITTIGLDEESINVIKNAYHREYFSTKKVYWAEGLKYYKLGPSDTIKKLIEKVLEEATAPENKEQVKAALDLIGMKLHGEYTVLRTGTKEELADQQKMSE